jgi:hypothetical protein
MTRPTRLPPRSPVARYAGRFNRAATFRDRTKYRRGAKHKGQGSFPLAAGGRQGKRPRLQRSPLPWPWTVACASPPCWTGRAYVERRRGAA